MSRALSVYHGRFGRATLYELNRPMTTHAHREGHLIFYVGGGAASVPVLRQAARADRRARESRSIRGSRMRFIAAATGIRGGVYLVLYIDQDWFQRMGRGRPLPLQFGRSEIEMTPRDQRDGRRSRVRCSRTTTPRRTSTARCSS